ncbi:MAG: oxidoreductase [bacterium]|nr:MAG: oxidoreductase [bacterium]KAF0147150.1 MAG: oxidoreductase [bacterium]KAF0165715.1 MAG: oxidoreductase [bacterium]
MITEPPPTPPVVAILGAGPAGMSCANACLSFGLAPVVIERDDHAGGAQRANFHPNLWMLGSPGETGEEMSRRMADHFATLAVPTRFRCEVTGVEMEGGRFRLQLAGGPDGAPASLRADAIVLATGMRPQASAELAALARACARVIVGPLSPTIRDGIHGREVLILGGGDNALDHALFLRERDNRVTVCTRAGFSARAAFLAACRDQAGITLRAQCRPQAILPRNDGLRVRWSDEERDFDWLLVMYGYRPNVDVLERFPPALRPALTAGSHVRVDAWQRTSVPGLYAAGDLTESAQPSVPTAIAQGLAAARAIERDRRAA